MSLYFEPFIHPASPFLAHSMFVVQGLKESHQWKLSCLHVLATKFCANPPISQNGEVYSGQQVGDSKDDGIAI